MGLFDCVWVECPGCGRKNLFQSKGSENCGCRDFDLDQAPEDVLSDVNRHAPISCEQCGVAYKVALKILVVGPVRV